MYPPRIGANTEVRFAYEYAHARGNFVYQVGPALPPPSQLPETFNKLQDLRLDVRHRINRRLVGTLSYVYEPSKIFDFAFDPSVINSIVQPSSLILGYTVPSIHGKLGRVRNSVLLVSFTDSGN